MILPGGMRRTCRPSKAPLGIPDQSVTFFVGLRPSVACICQSFFDHFLHLIEDFFSSCFAGVRVWLEMFVPVGWREDWWGCEEADQCFAKEVRDGG